jgi:filamentous hemagglutinin
MPTTAWADLHAANCGKTVQAIGDGDQDIGHTARLQIVEDLHPELGPFGALDPQAHNTAIDIAQGTQDTHVKQSGLSLGVSSTALNVAQGVAQMASSASKTSDPRMKALTLKVAATVIAKDGVSAGASISESLGASRSDSSAVQRSATAVGSQIRADGNVDIRATGAGQASTLEVIGRKIAAGGKARLQSDGQVKLEAASSTSEQHSVNSSSAGSIGVAYNFGGDTNGWSVNASASKGQGCSRRPKTEPLLKIVPTEN